MSGAHDSLLRHLPIAPITDKMEGMKITITNDKSDENPWEIETKESRPEIIDYPRLFLLRMRDHHLSQAPPVDLPSIQGVTFVRTCDNNNTESIRRDLSGVNPELYEKAGYGEIIKHDTLKNVKQDEEDEPNWE